MAEDYNYDKIKDYLNVEHSMLMDTWFWFILIFLNIIGLPTVLIGNPGIIIEAMLIPIIIINICNVIIRFNMEKYKVMYLLYKGASSLIFSILLVMAAYRFFILYHEAYKWPFILTTTGIYILILIFGFRYHFKKLKLGHYSYKYKGKPNVYVGVIAAASGCGLWLGKALVISTDNQSLITLVMVACLLIFGYMVEVGVHYVYKYYLMKRYRPELF